MNKSGADKTNAESRRGEHLLDYIRAVRLEVADELNDEEFTLLLLRKGLPAEAGFAFVSYCNQIVTLSVPQQDPANWHPEKGWILPAKVRIAKAIAEKYGLALYEPPDMTYPPIDKPNLHHHLELSNRRETIIVAHPQFVKIRLYPSTNLLCSTVPAYPPFVLGPELLKDLSALYKAAP